MKLLVSKIKRNVDMKTPRMFVKSIARKVPRFASLIDYAIFSISREQSRTTYSGQVKNICDQIAENGFFVIEDFMPKSYCDDVIRDFSDAKERFPESCHLGSDQRIFGIEEYSEKAYEFYAHPLLKSVSDSYCGQLTANAFTMFNEVLTKTGSLGSGEGWHKDSSFRQIKAFLYLSDVGSNDAPFQLIAKSHKIGNYLRHMRWGEMQFRELRISNSQIDNILRKDTHGLVTFKGSAGTLILADTAAIHRGKPPNGGKRYALTNYYVKPEQIHDEFLNAYRPVNAYRTLNLVHSKTGLKDA